MYIYILVYITINSIINNMGLRLKHNSYCIFQKSENYHFNSYNCDSSMDWGYPWAPHLRIFSDEPIGEVPIRQPSAVPLSSPEPFTEYRLLAWKPFTKHCGFCMFLHCKSMPVLLMHEKNMKNPYPGLYTTEFAKAA